MLYGWGTHNFRTLPPNDLVGRGSRKSLQLGQVVQVVSCHGFDDGLKGHWAALGMGDRPVGRGGKRGGNQQQIPPAECGKSRQSLLSADGGIGRSPLFLVEWLNGWRILGQRLAQTEAEDQFAVG